MLRNINHFHNVLSSEISLTQEYILAFTQTHDNLINKAIQHIVSNKGKMLRPILLILTAKYSFVANNEDKTSIEQFNDDTSRAAAILELIQMSSLMHDDVLDESNERRSQATINKLKGNRYAILLGDYLIAQSLKNCHTSVEKSSRFDSIILYEYLDSISKLVLGEILQNNLVFKANQDKNEISKYKEIIDNKTASLFSAACFAGATLANNQNKETSVFKELGHHIGMAYQIIDDIRDFAINKSTSQEKNYQDIIYGIKTLPLIYYSEHSNNGSDIIHRSFNCRKELTENEKSQILDLLINSGSIKRSFDMANEYIQAAYVILNKLQKNEYAHLLSEFLDFLFAICKEKISDIMMTKTH